MTAGQRIKRIRKELKITMEDFSKSILIPKAKLKKIEEDSSFINTNSLYLIYRRYGFSPNSIVIGDDFDKQCDDIRKYYYDSDVGRIVQRSIKDSVSNSRISKLVSFFSIDSSLAEELIVRFSNLWSSEPLFAHIILLGYSKHLNNTKIPVKDKKYLISSLSKFVVPFNYRKTNSFVFNNAYKKLFIDWIYENMTEDQCVQFLQDISKFHSLIESNLDFFSSTTPVKSAS